MDSKRRKASGRGASTGEDQSDRAAKKRKLPTDSSDISAGETPETTTHYGRILLEQIKKTEDKSGRLIATGFLTLPSKRQLPDYYKITRMPIALDTIEAKLAQNDFPTLSALESYFKRMIANAKEYNQKGSEIHNDAERLRKALSNFMTKTNPAYKTSGYVAVPTPFPDDDNSKDITTVPKKIIGVDTEVAETKTIPNRAARDTRTRGMRSSTSGETPATVDDQYSGISFTGLSFQQAQEKIVADMIGHQEDPDDAFPTFEPFMNRPPRSLKDYYQVIPHPTSLKVLQKQVRGVHGRNDPTGISDFKTWAALEEEASVIWKNACHYNEDGSEIYLLAKGLETYFRKSLEKAKKEVPEPTAPKIKLKMPESTPRIRLKLGGGKPSPAAESPAPPAQVTNGSVTETNGTTTNTPLLDTSAQASGLDRTRRSNSRSTPSATPSNPAIVKNEDGLRNSPAMAPPYSKLPTSTPVPAIAPSQTAVQPPPSASTMPPPITPVAPGPLTPAVTTQNYAHSGYAQSFPHPQQQPRSIHPSYPQRSPGSEPLLANVNLASHPALHIDPHFRMDIPPSPTDNVQSFTTVLPSTHYLLCIQPTLSPLIMKRQYKLFVTCGSSRLTPTDSVTGHGADTQKPLFDARISPGSTRIDIEIVANVPNTGGNGYHEQYEKVTIFAHLLKAAA